MRQVNNKNIIIDYMTSKYCVLSVEWLQAVSLL